MGKFDILTKKVEIEHGGEKHTYNIRPLRGEHLGLMYDVMSSMAGIETDEEAARQFTGEKAKKAHRMVFETLKESYPETDGDKLDRFASQHLQELIEPVISINQSVHDLEELE